MPGWKQGESPAEAGATALEHVATFFIFIQRLQAKYRKVTWFAGAIAKMKAMRAHAHGFAELMLVHVANDKAPDHTACWTAFSDLLDDGAIGSADWASKKKKQSASSAAVYDIAEFNNFTGSAAMQSPAPHIAHQFTAAKVKASNFLVEYEPLGPVKPISAVFKGKGKALAKRKHDEIDDKDEEEMDDGDSDGSCSGSQ